jgi:hypothetical protein
MYSILKVTNLVIFQVAAETSLIFHGGMLASTAAAGCESNPVLFGCFHDNASTFLVDPVCLKN